MCTLCLVNQSLLKLFTLSLSHFIYLPISASISYGLQFTLLHPLHYWQIFSAVAHRNWYKMDSTKFSGFYSIFVRFVSKFIAQTFYTSIEIDWWQINWKQFLYSIGMSDGWGACVLVRSALNGPVNIGKYNEWDEENMNRVA